MKNSKLKMEDFLIHKIKRNQMVTMLGGDGPIDDGGTLGGGPFSNGGSGGTTSPIPPPPPTLEPFD